MKINNFKFDSDNKSILIDTNNGVLKLCHINGIYTHLIDLKTMSRVFPKELIFMGNLYTNCINYNPPKNEKLAHGIVLSHLKQTFK